MLTRLPLTSHATPPPPATGFAKISDEKAIPRSKETGQQGFLAYVAAESPKAFAISTTSTAWAYTSARSNAMQAALDRCNATAKDSSCKLYAVDDAVVWDPAAAP